MSSIPVFINRYLCEVKCIGQKRTHRKSRINKKWRKRYGMKFAPCPGVMYRMLDKLICCPCAERKIRESCG